MDQTLSGTLLVFDDISLVVNCSPCEIDGIESIKPFVRVAGTTKEFMMEPIEKADQPTYRFESDAVPASILKYENEINELFQSMNA